MVRNRPARCAAALMIDYLLNVAVGISAGVGALVSALPGLQPHTLGLCLFILAALTIVNLRGVREPGALFLAPPRICFDPALRRRRIPGVHVIASRHGGALAESR